MKTQQSKFYPSNRQYSYFNELPRKTLFFFNGVLCKKRSTRTAEYMNGRWFYFGGFDLCVTGPYSRIDLSYFL